MTDCKPPLDTFWVIERYYGQTLAYWSGRAPNGFDQDLGYAIKFVDYQSGCNVLHHQCAGIGRVAEHSYVLAPQRNPV